MLISSISFEGKFRRMCDVDRMIEIVTPNFKLELCPKVYEGSSLYNVILHVNAVSNSFSVTTEIDTGTLQFDEFKKQLIRIYNSLSGTAELLGNDHQKIVFEATKTGHIKIAGSLGRFLREEDYKLSFEVEVDQTDLSRAIHNLQNER